MDSTKTARNFRNYKVWNDATELSAYVYLITDKMPYFEKKGLCDQLQRATVSISSNIAEGSAHPSDADFAKYLDIALGSSYEVETQLRIALRIGYISQDVHDDILKKVLNIEAQIVALIRSIRK